MKTENKQPFIKIENIFLTETSMYHLNEKELYLFSIVHRQANREKSYLTSVSILNNATHLKFAKREDHAVKIIKESLTSLREKEILKIISVDGEMIETLELKANDLICIVINEEKDKGHVQVTYDTLKQFDSMSEFYIYCAVKRWSNNGGFGCSFKRWGNVLSCSETKAKTLIKNAVDKKLIFKNIGDYGDTSKEQKIQQTNVYNIYPFDENQKSNMTKNLETKIANEEFRNDLEFDDVIQDTITIFKNSSDSNGNSIFPEKNDYVIYMEVREEIKSRQATKQELELIKVAEKRISLLEPYPKFNIIYSAAEDEFLNSLEDGYETTEQLSEEAKPLVEKQEDYASMF